MVKYLTYDARKKRKDKIRERAYLDQFCNNGRRAENLPFTKKGRKKKHFFVCIVNLFPHLSDYSHSSLYTLKK